MASRKFGTKKRDGHVRNASKRSRMKRAHETKTRQQAKKYIRRCDET